MIKRSAMTRNYKQKKRVKYCEEQLAAAIDAVKVQKMSVTLAAKKFNIPVTTLYDHTKGRFTKIGAGAPTVLSPMEEKEVVVSLQVLQDIGFGLTKELAGVVVRNYLKDQPDGGPILSVVEPLAKTGGMGFLNGGRNLWLSVSLNTFLLTGRFQLLQKLWMLGSNVWKKPFQRVD